MRSIQGGLCIIPEPTARLKLQCSAAPWRLTVHSAAQLFLSNCDWDLGYDHWLYIHSVAVFLPVSLYILEEKGWLKLGFMFTHPFTSGLVLVTMQKATQLFLRLRSLLVTKADRDVLSDASSFRRFKKDSRVIWRISLKPLFSCCKETSKTQDGLYPMQMGNLQKQKLLVWLIPLRQLQEGYIF